MERELSLRPATVVLAILLVVMFIGHFAITALSVGPVNPVALRFEREIGWYTGSMFQQAWTLFAPTPINDERGLLVRARVRGEEGGVFETEWYDITSGPISRIHEQRIFPPRYSRIISNGIQLMGWRHPVVDRLRERLAIQPIQGGDDLRLDVPLVPGEERFVDVMREILRQIATVHARDRWGENVEEVQVRLLVNLFPPFSLRHEPDSANDISVTDFEWLTVEQEN